MLRTLRSAFELTVAFVILFEEWGWRPLQRWLGRLARRGPLAAAERRIEALPPYGALAAFGLPAAAMLPIKLAALALLADDHLVSGFALIVAAKVVGTAVVARLFVLTKPALLTIGWFRVCYERWLAWKQALLARVGGRWPWMHIADWRRRRRGGA